MAMVAMLFNSCTPTDPRSELQNAHKLMQQNQFDNALPRIRTCLDMDSENVDAIIANALCVYNLQPRDNDACKNARLKLSRVTSTLAPTRFDAWYTYTWVLMEDMDYDKAVNAARRARTLFRSLHNLPSHENDVCDKTDLTLAKENLAYANLILMTADICRHNGLTEGMPFFKVALSIPSFAELPELYLAYAQWLLEAGRKRDAHIVASEATSKFSDNLPCAYNYALIDEYCSREMKLPDPLRDKLIRKFDRAFTFARKSGNLAIEKRIAAKMAQLQRR